MLRKITDLNGKIHWVSKNEMMKMVVYGKKPRKSERNFFFAIDGDPTAVAFFDNGGIVPIALRRCGNMYGHQYIVFDDGSMFAGRIEDIAKRMKATVSEAEDENSADWKINSLNDDLAYARKKLADSEGKRKALEDAIAESVAKGFEEGRKAAPKAADAALRVMGFLGAAYYSGAKTVAEVSGPKFGKSDDGSDVSVSFGIKGKEMSVEDAAALKKAVDDYNEAINKGAGK